MYAGPDSKSSKGVDGWRLDSMGKVPYSVPKCAGRRGLYKTLRAYSFVEAARILGGQVFV